MSPKGVPQPNPALQGATRSTGPALRRLVRHSLGVLGVLGTLAACTPDSPAPAGPDMTVLKPPSCSVTGDAGAAPGVKLTSVLLGSRIARPIQLLAAPDASKRVFIVSQTGHVWVTSSLDVNSAASDWLNLEKNVDATGAQSGLLALAFDPGFVQNGRFYVSYTRRQGATLQLVVSRLLVSAPPAGAANPASETVLLTVNLQADTHVSGPIAFGPDGYLYIGTSDGGQDGDPQDNAKSLGSLLGKILRIDVSKGDSSYAIPLGNPLVGQTGVREEIWAYGLRNPSRLSVDALTGALWASDQGQSTTEEINAITPGANYGWNGLQGIDCFKPMKNCSLADVVPPTSSYPRSEGSAVIGGLIYRGQKLPGLYGSYVFGDQASGTLWALPPVDDQLNSFKRTILGHSDRAVVGFGADADGELYVLDNKEGAICRVDPPDGTPPTLTWPLLLSKTGFFSDLKARKLSPGILSYDVNTQLWSDGAGKERGLYLPAGSKITYSDDTTSWEPPLGAVAIKTFLLGSKVIETRLLRREADGWHGASYRWNEAGTDANLMTSSAAVPISGQVWLYPSRGDCLRCHTKAASQVLGLSTAQLNLDHDVQGNGTVAAQITTFKQLGVLSNPPAQDPSMLARFPAPTDLTAPLSVRARAYLHANCAHCHQPGGLADATFDIRYTTPLASSGLCGVAPQKGDAEVPGSQLITLGSPLNSVMWLRMTSLKPTLRMPTLGTTVIDSTGANLIYDWIRSLATCN